MPSWLTLTSWATRIEDGQQLVSTIWLRFRNRADPGVCLVQAPQQGAEARLWSGPQRRPYGSGQLLSSLVRQTIGARMLTT